MLLLFFLLLITLKNFSSKSCLFFQLLESGAELGLMPVPVLLLSESTITGATLVELRLLRVVTGGKGNEFFPKLLLHSQVKIGELFSGWEL